MNKRVALKYIKTSLSVILVLGIVILRLFDASVVTASGGRLVLKASELNLEIKDGGGTHIDDSGILSINDSSSYSEVEINMDEDLHISAAFIYGDLTISGTKTLYLDKSSVLTGINVYGNLTLNDGVGLVINSAEGSVIVRSNNDKGGCVYSRGNITVIKGNGINAAKDIYIYSGTIESKYLSGSITNYVINCDRNLYISGGTFKGVSNCTFLSAINNLKISNGNFIYQTNNSFCIFSSEGNIEISGGNYNLTNNDNRTIFSGKGNISISSGTFVFNTKYDCLYAIGTIDIYGGNIVINGYKGGIYANGGFSFRGGYVEVNCQGRSAPIYSNNFFNIADNCYLDYPSDGEAKEFSENAYCVVDSTGNNPKKVILKEGTKPNSKKYTWKNDSTGWWIEDSTGWYPKAQWLKVDGKWYYFLESGYMDYSEYRDGYWLGADGALVDGYYGEWTSNSVGWWFEDTSGWYPTSQWVWINGSCYYFESSGYLATNKYVDGYWVGADGKYY